MRGFSESVAFYIISHGFRKKRNAENLAIDSASSRLSGVSDKHTVESFLNEKCERIIDQLKDHGKRLVKRLKEDFEYKTNSLKEEHRVHLAAHTNEKENSSTGKGFVHEPVKVVLICHEGECTLGNRSP